MDGYRVLAEYVPKSDYAFRIGRDLTAITAELGFTPLVDPNSRHHVKAAWFDRELHAEVRRTAQPNSEDVHWHQDGDNSPNAVMDCSLILWSNITPTQFQVGDMVFQPGPFQLVIANNLEVFHRRPPDAPYYRFSFRQRVERL
jgi:hypothetical protein